LRRPILTFHHGITGIRHNRSTLDITITLHYSSVAVAVNISLTMGRRCSFYGSRRGK